MTVVCPYTVWSALRPVSDEATRVAPLPFVATCSAAQVVRSEKSGPVDVWNFANYFVSEEGELPWQYNIIQR
jgi:hypothetical protein